jgi:hypothetical protein
MINQRLCGLENKKPPTPQNVNVEGFATNEDLQNLRNEMVVNQGKNDDRFLGNEYNHKTLQTRVAALES